MPLKTGHLTYYDLAEMWQVLDGLYPLPQALPDRSDCQLRRALRDGVITVDEYWFMRDPERYEDRDIGLAWDLDEPELERARRERKARLTPSGNSPCW